MTSDSYPQLLKIPFYGSGQGDGFGVEVFQLDVDFAQGLFEVEVFVLFLGGDANVAAGGEAPVVGCDLLHVHQLDQAFHVAQLALREAAGEPVGLFPEVADLFQLLDGDAAGFVGGLAGAGEVLGVGSRIALRFIRATGYVSDFVDEAGGEFVDEIGLFDEVAAGFGKGFECGGEFDQGGVGVGGLFPR